jgi:hypothetical protein
MGHLLVSSVSKDWAIVQITNAGVIKTLADKISAESVGSIALNVRQADATALTTHGSIAGTLSGAPVLMQVPSSNIFEEVGQFHCETLHNELEMGDCGAFVIDQDTKELYGYVIAGSRQGRFTTAFIMMASDTMREVQREHGWLLFPRQRSNGE